VHSCSVNRDFPVLVTIFLYFNYRVFPALVTAFICFGYIISLFYQHFFPVQFTGLSLFYKKWDLQGIPCTGYNSFMFQLQGFTCFNNPFSLFWIHYFPVLATFFFLFNLQGFPWYTKNSDLQGFPCIGYSFFMVQLQGFPCFNNTFPLFWLHYFPVLLTFFPC
jgi:hypothetical protein